MSFQIGPLQFPNSLFMAPMEGITDIPFRRIVKKHGCGVTCTQMIHAEALLRGWENRRVREISQIVEEEKPVGMQLCGPDPKVMAEGAKKAQDLGASFIDINMGCPAKNVVKVGSGAALMKEPDLAASIVRAMKDAVSIPITAKIRAGWDDRYRNAASMAKKLANEGVEHVAVHARTRAQRFKGNANWDLIAELKDELDIPVIGNGDIFEPEDVEKMKNQTGADGLMVARGALGNPWLFSESHPSVADIKSTLLEHLDLHLNYYPDMSKALITFRKHLVWYTKGLANSAEFRVRVFKEPSPKRIVEMVHEFFAPLDPKMKLSQNYAS